eukprot:683145-Alexandrium_andersonii.AAC.1
MGGRVCGPPIRIAVTARPFSGVLLGGPVAHGRCCGPGLSHATLATATRVRAPPPASRPPRACCACV